jgi:hypothetical protein
VSQQKQGVESRVKELRTEECVDKIRDLEAAIGALDEVCLGCLNVHDQNDDPTDEGYEAQHVAQLASEEV